MCRQIPTLPVDIPQNCHLNFHLTSHQRRIPQHQTLPVLNPQVIHLTYYQRILTQFHILIQETLPVLNPRVLHLTSHNMSLPQIHILYQVTLPMDIPTFSLSNTQLKCSRLSSTRLKWYLPSLLSASIMHLQPNSSHRWELPGNYPVFTAVMVIYHYVERIWRILVTPIF